MERIDEYGMTEEELDEWWFNLPYGMKADIIFATKRKKRGGD